MEQKVLTNESKSKAQLGILHKKVRRHPHKIKTRYKLRNGQNKLFLLL